MAAVAVMRCVCSKKKEKGDEVEGSSISSAGNNIITVIVVAQVAVVHICSKIVGIVTNLSSCTKI